MLYGRCEYPGGYGRPGVPENARDAGSALREYFKFLSLSPGGETKRCLDPLLVARGARLLLVLRDLLIMLFRVCRHKASVRLRHKDAPRHLSDYVPI